MGCWRGVVVGVAVLAGGCSGGDGGGRAAPKAGEQVVVAEFGPEFLPRGVAVDGAGTVYTSGWDGEQFVIAAFPEEGEPTRRPIPCATEKGFDLPSGELVAAADGTLYWAAGLQFRVVRIDPDGEGACFAGTGERGLSGDGGPATEAGIGPVDGLAYDEERGELYLGDSTAKVVRKVDAAGVITTVAGPEGFSGTGWLYGVFFDQRRGRLYTFEDAGIVYREAGGSVTVVPDTGDLERHLDVLGPDPTGGDLVVTRQGQGGQPPSDVVRVGESGQFRVLPGSDLFPASADAVAVDGRGDIWLVTDDDYLIVLRPPR